MTKKARRHRRRGLPRLSLPRWCSESLRGWFGCRTWSGLILACRIIHLHYLVICKPFLFVWLALVMAKRRRMLAVLVLAQALIASAILVDLHMRGGATAGEYGVSYRARKH